MNIKNELTELVNADIITEETANDIRHYYKSKASLQPNRLVVVFGILGAILVGLGIILIIAHNWDFLSRTTKLFFAFLPMLIGQIMAGYFLLKKPISNAWLESTAAFLFFSIGACISLVSQVYHISGELSSFLLLWMLLCFPLIYIMKSSIVSLLYVIGITYYACENSYWTYPHNTSYTYWLLLLMALPYYYQLYKEKVRSNWMTFHNWIIPLSVVFALGTTVEESRELMVVGYISLFGFYYLVGELEWFSKLKLKSNSYRVLGSLGSVVLLLFLSFDWYWNKLTRKDLQFNTVVELPEFISTVVLSLMALWLFISHIKTKELKDINPLTYIFVLFIGTFILGHYSSISIVLVNIYIFGIGIWTIRNGAKQDNFGILNFGLLLISILVLCRFFDTDISFVLRGVMFVLVGVGFFGINYWMLKKRRTNE